MRLLEAFEGILWGMTPSFKMHGSKARIRNWVTSLFPDEIQGYREPFVGRGNVLFKLLTDRELVDVCVNDLYMSHFLSSLKEYSGDFNFIPEDPITREKYDRWFNAPKSLERDIVECVLAYNGNVFGGGVNNTLGSKNRHSKASTIKRLIRARELLSGVYVTALPWDVFLDSCSSKDFVYLDPPYVGTKCFYPNIDHALLVEKLNAASFRWALSGYENELYTSSLLFKNAYHFDRASCAKANSGASGDKIVKREWAWTNY